MTNKSQIRINKLTNSTLEIIMLEGNFIEAKQQEVVQAALNVAEYVIAFFEEDGSVSEDEVSAFRSKAIKLGKIRKMGYHNNENFQKSKKVIKKLVNDKDDRLN